MRKTYPITYDETAIYAAALAENDCASGDDIFTKDLQTALKE